MDYQTNPFAVLSLIIAPAVLTNASSLLIMSTANRLARTVDRARALTAQLERSGARHKPSAVADLQELTATGRRALMLVRALRYFYIAVGGFASSAFLALIGALLIPAGPGPVVVLLEIVGLAAGLVAVGGLLVGSLLLVREVRIAVGILQERAAHLLSSDGSRSEALPDRP